ncbi:MAG: thiamine phosphate synthase [Microcystis novacekii Mn_MB_F_20050700_S1]|uniref:Thiamine-phosphate synthase n=1 Tax=Microcystis novacekii Mn_MB_F_20050700_S1D TaxID=2486266 RepID=A0A552J6H0_9CHRO|nr:MAG: thiamine phosphate synthase [Microcystis novacekii Mn_MB_F_20050700_S1]TRU91345.1 MAG: thiamine phosphate synthase [Microcystis novacekii Mn_MB_F_20050700_S1D]
MKLETTAIKRILDANLDRAREGLRIIEEWCRFGLDNPDLAQECKEMRHQLASWHSIDLKRHRDTAGDIGTNLSHPREEIRETVEGLLQANLARVQEAFRVLEEYGKLYDLELGIACKQLRYRVYQLESQLLISPPLEKLKASPLYLVTSPAENLLEIVELALKGGLKLVQYRHKTAVDTIRLEEAAKLCELCHRYDALFIMNDRVDIARAVNADGVHLGQQDLPISLARQFLGPTAIIGRSTTNPQEMAKAIQEKADYVGVGPVYATPTKAGKTPAGLEYVRYARENCPLPWFAIGGIDSNNIKDVLEAGAQRVAVVRAIMEAQHTEVVTQQLLDQLK